MFRLFLVQVLDVKFTKRESDAMFTVQICTHVDCSVVQSHFHCSDLIACSPSTVNAMFTVQTCTHVDCSVTVQSHFHCSDLIACSPSTVHIACRFHCSHLMSRTLPTFVSPSLFSRHATDTFFFFNLT